MGFKIRPYPNPTSGLLNIDFKRSYQECLLEVINESGVIVHSEYLGEVSTGKKTFYLSALDPGVYFVRLHLPVKDIIFRFIKVK